MNEAHIENVARFVVEYLEAYTDEDKARMRLYGIDPDNNWLLKWSFATEEEANARCKRDIEIHEMICKQFDREPTTQFRVRDVGKSINITNTFMI